MSEQCRVKLTAGRVKSQGGVDGTADVITSDENGYPDNRISGCEILSGYYSVHTDIRLSAS